VHLASGGILYNGLCKRAKRRGAGRKLVRYLLSFKRGVLLLSRFSVLQRFPPLHFMIEKHFILEEADPVIFYGANNANIKLLRALYPKIRIMARDNVVRVVGGEDEMAVFEEIFSKLERHCSEFNSLTEADVVNIVRGERTGKAVAQDVIVYSTGGKPITPRSENQKKLVEAYRTSDMIFAVGPAGSGKTYTAIALAVRALKAKEVKKVILCRPAVEAGEKLGFLPGDMKDKIDPYLQPLYDALQEMIPAAKLQEYMDTNVIQIAPLALCGGARSMTQ